MKTDNTHEFAEEFRALVEKYGVEMNLDWGYYGELDGVQLCIGEKVAVSNLGSGSAWFYCDTNTP